MFKLLKHFSIMSALAITAISTVLVLGFRWFEYRNLLQLAEDRNVSQTYAFAHVIQDKFAAHLAAAPSLSGAALRSHPTTQLLDDEVLLLTRGLPVLKVKIYSPDGMTIYSSDRSDIGLSRLGDPAFVAAVWSGKPNTKLGWKAEIVSFDRSIAGRNLAESYVPIQTDDGGISSVFEIYSDITAYMREVDRSIWTMMAMLLAALATLYVLLLLVVRRADMIIRRQYNELETFNTRLEEKVAERTERLLGQQSVLSWVTKSDEFRSGDLQIAFGNLTRITAATLEVDRVSIWTLSRERDFLKCIDLYSVQSGEHSRGQELSVERYPSYFEALFAQDQLSFDEAQSDPRLEQFRESYLKPLNVGSMLDVPIVHGGRTEGVLCIEHVGEPIKWTAEQRLFAIAIANFASLALERQERLKAEVDLRAANRSVEAANRAKSLFLANMSHEIRTPMNGVFGMTDLLMRTELTERQRKFVHIISGSAKRLLTIINDILDLSRIESGKLELDCHEFALREALEETIDLMAGEAERKGLDLSILVDPDVPASVRGDSGRLRQVLTNLVSNAVKFTKDGEVVVKVGCVSVSGGVANIAFEVSDTGIGIAGEVQQRLFAPFQQADTSIARRFGGTGLGLSISRHLVELMGGYTTLDSAPGRGTSIKFTLPLPVCEMSKPPTGERRDHAIVAGRRVLVVDDRAANREVVETYFRDWGVETFAASSAAEALEELARASDAAAHYDIAVVDMVMPEANGFDFARMVRAHPELAATKLIMLTSMSWKGDTRAARELGFAAFLTKPVHRDELLRAAISALSDRPAATEQGIADEAGPVGAVTGNLVTGDVVTGDAAAVDTNAEGDARGRSGLGLKVLVAEDNPVNLEVAREYLLGLGCAVTCVENGRLAVEAVNDGSFDLVLMDCQMPEMDGITATRTIRDNEARAGRGRIVIVAATANAFAEDKAECLEAGMDDYMSKPFSEQQLQKLLDRWAPKAIEATVAIADVSAGDDIAASRPVPALGHAAAPVEQADVEKALDTEQLRRMQKTHPTLVSRLVDTYLSYGPKAIKDMLSALVEQDIEKLKTTAHSLKSSSANIGAMGLSVLCRELEARMKVATAWEADVNIDAVAEIESSFQAVAAALGNLRDELKAAAPAAQKARA